MESVRPFCTACAAQVEVAERRASQDRTPTTVPLSPALRRAEAEAARLRAALDDAERRLSRERDASGALRGELEDTTTQLVEAKVAIAEASAWSERRSRVPPGSRDEDARRRGSSDAAAEATLAAASARALLDQVDATRAATSVATAESDAARTAKKTAKKLEARLRVEAAKRRTAESALARAEAAGASDAQSVDADELERAEAKLRELRRFERDARRARNAARSDGG